MWTIIAAVRNYVIWNGMQRFVGPRNHGKARPQISGAGTASRLESLA